MKGIILSLCDYTGNWSKPWREAGYEVIQIDLKHGTDAILWPSAPSNEPRFPRGFEDIRGWIGKVYGMLAAPTCTFLSGSGACRKRSDDEMREALALFDACLRISHVLNPRKYFPTGFWVIENPVGKAVKWYGQYRMTFQPCDYGDPYTKRTCLWGEFHPPKKSPVDPIRVCSQGSWVQKLGGRSERTKELRSATPMGFANAFYEANRADACYLTIK